MERTYYILDTLSAEYIQLAFTDYSRSFIICILWAILHDDDNDME